EGQALGLNGSQDIATWLTLVSAITKLTVLRESYHVREDFQVSFCRTAYSKFAHTGGIDQKNSSFRHKEFPVRGCVTSPGVVLSFALYLLGRATQEVVDQARLSYSGKPHKSHGLSDLKK